MPPRCSTNTTSCSVSAPAGAHAGGDHLAELEPRRALRDRLEVMRVVVLAVDEDDLLGAPGDVELAAVHEAQVAGAQPAVGGERGGVRLPGPRSSRASRSRRVMCTWPMRPCGQLAVLIVGDAHAAVGDRPALAHEPQRVRSRRRATSCTGSPDVHAVAVQSDGAQRRADRREAHRERGFREAVHRVHGVARQPRRARGASGTPRTARPRSARRR